MADQTQRFSVPMTQAQIITGEAFIEATSANLAVRAKTITLLDLTVARSTSANLHGTVISAPSSQDSHIIAGI